MTTREEYVSRIVKHLLADHIQSAQMWDDILDDKDIANPHVKLTIQMAMWDVESHLEDEHVKSTIKWKPSE